MTIPAPATGDPGNRSQQMPTGDVITEPARGPNTAQAALLRRLRDVYDGLRRMNETGRLGGEFGHFPTELWNDYVEEMHARADELTALGRAGGIPSPWLDYARGYGADTTGMQVPDRWPDMDSVARTDLVTALADKARELAHITAVHAAYQPRTAGEPQRAQDAFAERLGQRWDHIATIAALLKPVGAERELIWPADDPTWVAAFADPVRDADPSALAQRWRRHLSTPDAAAAHAALADYGDLTWNPDHELLPPPETMTAQIGAALRAGPAVGGGAAIDADIGAALPEIAREYLPDTTTPNHRGDLASGLDAGPEP